jgi:hypothetical protein
LLFQREDRIPIQRDLVEHIQHYPHTVVDFEYSLVKEMGAYIRLLRLARRFEEFKLVSRSYLEMKLTNPLASYERILNRFPWEISMAIQSGDYETGITLCNELLSLLDTQGVYPDVDGFVSINLFVCAYFYLSAGIKDGLGKALGRLARIRKKEFISPFFMMSRILRILMKIDLENWEEAAYECHLVKKMNFPKNLGIEHAVEFLDEYIRSKGEAPHFEIVSKLGQLKGKAVIEYVDLFVWMESKQKKCPMLQIFAASGM